MKLTTASKFAPIALAFSLLTGPALAQAIDLNTSHRSDADKTRDATSKPAQIIEFAQVKPGMVVVDIFGGSGYYSELLSQAVGPDGRVYLHNNKAYLPYVGKELDARLADKSLTNVVRWDREADALELPKAQTDRVFFVLGYHDIFYHTDGWQLDEKTVMSQLYDSLKPGGMLLVIDHAAKANSNTQYVQDLHRIDEQFVKQQLPKWGFKLVSESKLLRNEADQHDISVFDASIRRKTDRFVQLWQKPVSKL